MPLNTSQLGIGNASISIDDSPAVQAAKLIQETNRQGFEHGIRDFQAIADIPVKLKQNEAISADLAVKAKLAPEAFAAAKTALQAHASDPRVDAIVQNGMKNGHDLSSYLDANGNWLDYPHAAIVAGHEDRRIALNTELDAQNASLTKQISALQSEYLKDPTMNAKSVNATIKGWQDQIDANRQKKIDSITAGRVGASASPKLDMEGRPVAPAAPAVTTPVAPSPTNLEPTPAPMVTEVTPTPNPDIATYGALPNGAAYTRNGKLYTKRTDGPDIEGAAPAPAAVPAPAPAAVAAIASATKVSPTAATATEDTGPADPYPNPVNQFQINDNLAAARIRDAKQKERDAADAKGALTAPQAATIGDQLNRAQKIAYGIQVAKGVIAKNTATGPIIGSSILGGTEWATLKQIFGHGELKNDQRSLEQFALAMINDTIGTTTGAASEVRSKAGLEMMKGSIPKLTDSSAVWKAYLDKVEFFTNDLIKQKADALTRSHYNPADYTAPGAPTTITPAGTPPSAPTKVLPRKPDAAAYAALAPGEGYQVEGMGTNMFYKSYAPTAPTVSPKQSPQLDLLGRVIPKGSNQR